RAHRSARGRPGPDGRAHRVRCCERRPNRRVRGRRFRRRARAPRAPVRRDRSRGHGEDVETCPLAWRHGPPIVRPCPGSQRDRHHESSEIADFAARRSAREHGGMASVGLVLGAGGVVGGAYHAGALAALAEAADWDARDADVVVGTSAGSIAGAALRAGLSGPDQFARATSGPLSTEGARLVGAQPPLTDFPSRPPFPRGLPLPASPQLAATALLPPWRARPVAALAGVLPAGSVPPA